METGAAKVVIDRDFVIGAVDPRIFGSFVEHMERVVYGGIYEPGHPLADEEGFRKDIIGLVREMGIPIVRYPGGNFLSGYNWLDGIGPRDRRPRQLDLAWIAVESNEIGLNEFLAWSRKAGTEVNMAVNLGTQGIDAARHIVEYCNHSGGSTWSDLRKAHGHAAPYGIRTWCLGNEMDGPWQIGSRTAQEYGRIAAQAGMVMKKVDRDIELVACGSSNDRIGSYPEWDSVVLDHTYDVADYISLHIYYSGVGSDTPTYLARTLDMDRQIKTIVAACDLARAKKRSRKTMYLSFDEWGLWSEEERAHRNAWSWRWEDANAISEGMYSFEDALVAGSMLLTLLNNADRVRIACQAQLVNHLSLFNCAKGGASWKQTLFYPFKHASLYGRGTALRCVVDSPRYDTKEYGGVPLLDTAAVAGDGTLTIFAINRDLEKPLVLETHLRGLGRQKLKEHIVYESDDLKAGNTLARPDAVVPRAGSGCVVDGERLRVALRRASWNVIRLESVRQ